MNHLEIGAAKVGVAISFFLLFLTCCTKEEVRRHHGGPIEIVIMSHQSCPSERDITLICNMEHSLRYKRSKRLSQIEDELRKTAILVELK